MTKTIRVFAMRRSGHHAIMTWILRQCPNYKFDNDPLCYADFFHTSGNGEGIKLFNLEDWDLSTPAPAGDIDILILRDPYNTFASRILKKENWPLKDRRVRWTGKKPTSLWIQHAKEFLRESQHLTNPVIINYNLWISDENYRVQIASQLGINLIDNNIDFEPISGAKCDFLDKKYLERWKQYADHNIFLYMVESKELRELSKQIFGPIGDELPKKKYPI